MKRRNLFLSITLLLVILILGASVFAYAQANWAGIKSGEVIPKSWYGAGEIITNDGTVSGDMFAAGGTVTSNGIVEKDMIGAAQTMKNTGTVNGDIIFAAENINVEGATGGNVRIAAQYITVTGSVGKNVNAFAGTVSIKDTSDVGGNLTSFSDTLNISGKIHGDALIFARDITLNGEFFGDVDINPGNAEAYFGSNNTAEINILPGTIIHGKLTYSGANEIQIRNGAKIADVQWIKPNAADRAARENQKRLEYVYDFVKVFFTTIVYYLIGLLFYRLFPEVFRSNAEIIGKKPFAVMGTGVIGLLSIFSSFVFFVILMLVSAVLTSHSIGLMFAVVALLIYTILIYFSTIPIALWLGNIINKDSHSIPYKFGAGLALYTLGRYAINLLSEFDSIRYGMETLNGAIVIMSSVFGVGALLYGIKSIYVAAKKGQESDKPDVITN